MKVLEYWRLTGAGDHTFLQGMCSTQPIKVEFQFRFRFRFWLGHEVLRSVFHIQGIGYNGST